MSTRRASSSEGSAATPIEDTLFSRLIVAPVLFVSFLLSLFLIDRQTVGGVFGQHTDKGSYYHSHQRKLAKHDLNEAFVMRNKVIAAMCVSSAVGLALAGWAVSKGYYFLMRS